MATPAFTKYQSAVATIKGVREFSNMVNSKITQLRSERTKTLYNYVHTEIVPLVDKMRFPYFESVIKSLSRLYRSKIDLDEGLKEMRSYIDEILTDTPAHPDEKTDEEVSEYENETESEDEQYSPAKQNSSHAPRPSINTEPEHSPSSEDPKTPTHRIAEKKGKAKVEKKSAQPDVGRKSSKHVVNKADMVKMLQDALNDKKST